MIFPAIHVAQGRQGSGALRSHRASFRRQTVELRKFDSGTALVGEGNACASEYGNVESAAAAS